MLAALTGSGLSAAAGLNAFIPFVLVAMLLILAVVLFRLYRLRRHWLRHREDKNAGGTATAGSVPA